MSIPKSHSALRKFKPALHTPDAFLRRAFPAAAFPAPDFVARDDGGGGAFSSLPPDCAFFAFELCSIGCSCVRASSRNAAEKHCPPSARPAASTSASMAPKRPLNSDPHSHVSTQPYKGASCWLLFRAGLCALLKTSPLLFKVYVPIRCQNVMGGETTNTYTHTRTHTHRQVRAFASLNTERKASIHFPVSCYPRPQYFSPIPFSPYISSIHRSHTFLCKLLSSVPVYYLHTFPPYTFPIHSQHTCTTPCPRTSRNRNCGHDCRSVVPIRSEILELQTYCC